MFLFFTEMADTEPKMAAASTSSEENTAPIAGTSEMHNSSMSSSSSESSDSESSSSSDESDSTKLGAILSLIKKKKLYVLNLSEKRRLPFHVAFEGNIGSGKSTLLPNLVSFMKKRGFKDLLFTHEPVETWKNYGNEVKDNILDLYYRFPNRFSFFFQCVALSTKTKQLHQSKDKDRMVERSLLAQSEVFIPLLFDTQKINAVEVHQLKEQIENSLLIEGVAPQLIVYVKCPPEICLQRIQKRGRVEEKNIPIEYLQAIDKSLEDWLVKRKKADIVIDNSGRQKMKNIMKQLLLCKKFCDLLKMNDNHE